MKERELLSSEREGLLLLLLLLLHCQLGQGASAGAAAPAAAPAARSLRAALCRIFEKQLVSLHTLWRQLLARLVAEMTRLLSCRILAEEKVGASQMGGG